MGEWSDFDIRVIAGAGYDHYRLVGPKNQVYKRRTKYPEQFIPANREITRIAHQLVNDGDLAIGQPETITCWDPGTPSEYSLPALTLLAIQASAVYPAGGEPVMMSDKGFAQNARHTRATGHSNIVGRLDPAWSPPGDVAPSGASLGERPRPRTASSTSAKRDRDDRSRG